MIHPITGKGFDHDACMWRVVVDSPKQKHLVSYPCTGQALYDFTEASRVAELLNRGYLVAWIESDTMRMDIETIRELEA